MKKQNLLIIGGIALALGIIMVIHGNARMSTITGALIRFSGRMPPGGGEMGLGMLFCLGGVILLLVGAIKKDKLGSPVSETKHADPESMAIKEGFEEKIKANPLDTSLLLKYAKFLYGNQLYNDTILILLKLLTVDENDVEAQHLLFKCYNILERVDEAFNIGKKLSELKHDDLELLEELSDIAEKAGDFRFSLVSLDKALDLEPNNKDVWSKKAKALQRLGEEVDSLKAWKRVLEIDRYDPQASLFIGMALYDREEFSKTVKLIEPIVEKFAKNSIEQNKSYLYLGLAMIKSGVGEELIDEFTDKIDVGKVSESSERHRSNLGELFLLIGKNQLSNKNYQAAINAFKKALDMGKETEASELLAKAYSQEGDRFFLAKKYHLAQINYEAGLLYKLDATDIDNKRITAHAKQRKRKVSRLAFAAMAILIIVAIPIFFYYSQGSFHINVAPTAKISLMKGNKVLSSNEGDSLNTGFLRYGSYLLRITKAGYQPIEEWVKVGFGRQLQWLEFNLKPIYGSIKVDSDPSGAKVVIRNDYQRKTCKTPCEIADLFAMPSTIEVTHTNFSPFKFEKEIFKDKVLDLGTINFKGGLKIDSNPAGADVYINDIKKGVAPITINDLLAKIVRVRLNLEGKGSYYTSVQVLPGKTLDLGVIKLGSLYGVWKSTWRCSESVDCVTYIVFDQNQKQVTEAVFWPINTPGNLVVQRGPFEKTSNNISVKHVNVKKLLGKGKYNPDRRLLSIVSSRP